jgi:hypothetical protein
VSTEVDPVKDLIQKLLPLAAALGAEIHLEMPMEEAVRRRALMIERLGPQYVTDLKLGYLIVKGGVSIIIRPNKNPEA